MRRSDPAPRTRRNFLLVTAISVVVMASAWAGPAANLKVTGLKCEYRTNPIGLDSPQPRLSWILESSERGQSQTAYQVLAASAPEMLSEGRADLWDSGRVSSSQSIHVTYAGKPLRSEQRVYWKVRAWDRDNRPSAFSKSAWWEMGLLAPADWGAKWITRTRPEPWSEAKMFDDDPAPLFRREFSIEKKVSRARLYAAGLGYGEFHLNGERVGDHVLDPGWTSYSKRVLYSSYDVTAQIKRGRNALGVMLGNGWLNPLPLRLWGWLNLRDHLTVGEPRVIARLIVDFADGTSQTVITDESWKVESGAIVRNNVYLGEVYDARKEKPGWDRGGYDDGGWKPAALATEPLGPLRAQEAPPIRVTRAISPVKLTEPGPGVFIFDMGQNFAGVVRLRVKGPAGTCIKMRYGELLYSDGTLNGMTSVCGQIKAGGKGYDYRGEGPAKTAWQMDEYILKGNGEEVYTPRFTFHGFRYVEVTGFPGKPTLSALEGLRLNSDVESAGSFSCSNERFNRIQQMVLWTELSNLFSVQSDCPHREKFGYGGDLVADSDMAIFNFNMSRFYAKAVNDFGDSVRPNGGFTETAPFVGIVSEGLGEKAGPVDWGAAQPLLQWQLYQFYGDKRLLEENYELTKSWMSFLESRARDGILDNGISDHESLAPKPRALTGTAFYYLNANLFSHIARALGRSADAAHAEALAQKIKSAFNQKFLRPGTGRYDIATQACQSFALYLGLVPPQEKDRAVEVLLRDVIDAHQGHLTTGIFGTKYMLQALADADHAEAAYGIVNQKTFPGWGYMLENGATTLWEHWEFSDNTYSHNHPMFGSVSEWFFRVLAGINPASDAAGFDKVIIRPRPVGDLKWVKASHNSVRGKIVSEWSRAGETFHLRIQVPVGAEATVYLPAKAQDQILEGAKPLERGAGVRFLRMEKGKAVIATGSGEYNFTSMTR